MPKTRNINAVIDEALADPARRANIERERMAAMRGMVIHSLGELRKTRQVTQVELARMLNCGQSTISGLEHSGDPFLSTPGSTSRPSAGAGMWHVGQ